MAGTDFDNIAKLYDKLKYAEEQRLEEHPMEKEVTIRLIKKYVKGKKLVDIGGGPGTLAKSLLDAGFEVDLIDTSPESVALAQ